MQNTNPSPPPILIPCRVLLRCPLCYGIFRTHFDFMNHLQFHPLSSEQDVILRSGVDAAALPSQSHLQPTQPAPPQHASSRRNDRGIVLPSSSSSNRSHPTNEGHQMARRNRGRAPSTTFLDLNVTHDGTKPLINQLDVPISSNAVALDEEPNGLDLSLRL
ncbi:hypothetical protein A4A49_53815 [Nicotiana attenuata]|uniref:C2H2-type domain-containing protein n=1 Tax=Nicotiana attenuata TaxID=49451 RepID=A0A314LDS9_NICAT|nr:hypothetical protein A4A49_53815 [Nicotiana attenuata]